MAGKEDILGPREIARILRAADNKTSLRPLPCWFYKEGLQGGLAIICVSSEIGQCSASLLWRSNRLVEIRIDTAIERCDLLRPELVTERGQCPASGITQNQIKWYEAIRSDIIDWL